MSKVKPDGVVDAVLKVTEEQFEKYEQLTERVIKEVAQEGVEILKATSPVGKRRRGKYRSTWKSEVTQNVLGRSEARVYNDKNSGLTHLLERGHAKRNGRGRTRAIPHIKPAEEKMKKSFEDKLKQSIEKA